MAAVATLVIPIDHDRIAAFCERNGIRRLALFGSVLTDQFGSDSDIDVLVEFYPNQIPGWNFFGMHDELEAMWGRRVDLNTAGFLNKRWRDEAIASLLELYAAP